MNIWTDEAVTRLQALWETGMSAAQIADRLNTEFEATWSRNAVIGKLHRSKCYSRPTKASPRYTRPAVRSVAPPKRQPQPKGVGAFVLPSQRGAGGRNAHIAALVQNAAVKLAPHPDVAKRAGAFEPLPGTEPRIWTERPFMGCAWPVGGEGADTLSCCAPTDGRTYCATHHAMAHTASPPSKRATEKHWVVTPRRRAA